MTHHPKQRALAVLAISMAALLAVTGLLAAAAFADDGGMSGMPGMTDQEMQNMVTPTPAATAAGGSMPATGASQAGDMGPAMDPHMDMGGGSVNWLVIGGFVALVAGSTVAAVATKRRVRGRMAAGELAGAGALDV
jgi:roadblock/LC7 domain-containing protein